jgi:hypothetical protein
LGLVSEYVGQLLGLLPVILDGNVGGDLDSLGEPAAGHGVLGFISVEYGQISGPLEMVMCHEGILEVNRLLLIGHLETAALLLLLRCKW